MRRSTDMTEPLRLYTFSLSHFSEKIRWTLGLENIDFVEVPWVPPFHVPEARRSGRGTTVPVIDDGMTRVQDSTRILHWLDTNRGPLMLLPQDEDQRREALAIEDRFDQIGSDVIRLSYDHVLNEPETVVRLWTIDGTPMQRTLLRMLFPIFRILFRRRLGTRPEQIAASRERVESALGFIEERTRAQPYLLGDRITIADVTAASLLAPFVCPDEHPVYATDEFRNGIAPVVEAWRARPAFEWVRRVYRERRGVWPRADHVARVLASYRSVADLDRRAGSA